MCTRNLTRLRNAQWICTCKFAIGLFHLGSVQDHRNRINVERHEVGQVCMGHKGSQAVTHHASPPRPVIGVVVGLLDVGHHIPFHVVSIQSFGGTEYGKLLHALREVCTHSPHTDLVRKHRGCTSSTGRSLQKTPKFPQDHGRANESQKRNLSLWDDIIPALSTSRFTEKDDKSQQSFRDDPIGLSLHDELNCWVEEVTFTPRLVDERDWNTRLDLYRAMNEVISTDDLQFSSISSHSKP